MNCQSVKQVVGMTKLRYFMFTTDEGDHLVVLPLKKSLVGVMKAADMPVNDLIVGQAKPRSDFAERIRRQRKPFLGRLDDLAIRRIEYWRGLLHGYASNLRPIKNSDSFGMS